MGYSFLALVFFSGLASAFFSDFFSAFFLAVGFASAKMEAATLLDGPEASGSLSTLLAMEALEDDLRDVWTFLTI
jgi:hypothetical protein